MVRLNIRHTLIVHGFPPLDLFPIISIPVRLRPTQKALLSPRIPDLLHRTRLILIHASTHLGSTSNGFVRVKCTTRIWYWMAAQYGLLLPLIASLPPYTWGSLTANVGRSRGQGNLVLRRCVCSRPSRSWLHSMSSKTLKSGSMAKLAGVEPDREPSVVQIHVRGGGEDEGKAEKLARRLLHERVSVDRSERGPAQLGPARCQGVHGSAPGDAQPTLGSPQPYFRGLQLSEKRGG